MEITLRSARQYLAEAGIVLLLFNLLFPPCNIVRRVSYPGARFESGEYFSPDGIHPAWAFPSGGIVKDDGPLEIYNHRIDWSRLALYASVSLIIIALGLAMKRKSIRSPYSDRHE